MTSKLRLRDFIGTLLLIGCGSLGVGCSATSGPRFRPAEGSKSVASVGDQALPPSVGAPGSRVVSDVAESEPYRNPKARISGRVVDPQGRPVSGASVRLADGSSKAGRDVETTTDPSGGFTLSNLRPGSNYFLVAEANFGDEQGTISGQAQADTSQTGVLIRLGDSAPTAKATPTGRRGSRSSKARPISDQVDAEIKSASPSGINDEDLGPPVEAAELVNPPEPRKPKKAKTADPEPSNSSPSWRRPGSDPIIKSDSRSNAPDAEPQPDPGGPPDLDPGAKVESSPRPGRLRAEDSVDVDEENPLPLALPLQAKPKDQADDSPTRPISRRTVKPPRRRLPQAEPRPDPSGELTLGSEVGSAAQADSLDLADGSMSAPKAMPSLMSLIDSSPEIQPDPPGPAGAPPPLPVESESQTLVDQPSPAAQTPGGLVFDPKPGSATATEPTDPSANYNPFSVVAAAPLDSPRAVRPESSASAARSSPATAPDPMPEVSTPEPSPTPLSKPRKWSDLVPATPVTASAPAEKGVAAVPVVATTRPNSFLARRSKSVAPAKPDAEALCQFDSQLGQLVDFQLPDLNGQPVRFRDLDADYILLDFWGTWCQPCVGSIPHLVELQKKYGPNKLRVVGIACENEPTERRKANVGAAAEKLGINYSVLVASKDGSCPVQRDFQVRFYPTMILLDRKGKILWRAEGATKSNLLRLDRALAETERPTQTARR